MKTATYHIVFVTVPDLATARDLASVILKERAAACVNLLPQIESHYWWNGKIERGAEILMVVKTLKSKLNTLEKLVLKHHPYDTPEFVAVPITNGNPEYLQWIHDTCLSKMTHDDLAAKLRSAK